MTPAIRVDLRCVPPNTTAQKKRLAIINGKPVFFHNAKLKEAEQTWTALLMPFVPAAPMDGPVAVTFVGIWPHTKSTPKRDSFKLLPKITKPDSSNYSKHLEDLLVRLRFLAEDSHVSRLVIEKWRGPAELVGIRIAIIPVELFAQPCL